MRLFILVFCINFVASKPQGSENGYQFSGNSQTDRLANLGLQQKLGSATTSTSASTNNINISNNLVDRSYLPPSSSTQQRLNVVQQKFTNDLTKSIGIVTTSQAQTIPHNTNNLQQHQQHQQQQPLASSTFSVDAVGGHQQLPIQNLQSHHYAPNYNSNGFAQFQQQNIGGIGGIGGISGAASINSGNINNDVIEKNIYVHLPSNDQQQYYQQPQQQPRRHYKIIFVKAPQRATPPPQPIQEVEEKTLVYVLVKKPDEANLDELQHAAQQNYKSSKPEVYFIKYRTGQTDGSNILPSDQTQNLDGSEDISLTTHNRQDQQQQQQQQPETDFSIPSTSNRLYDAPT